MWLLVLLPVGLVLLVLLLLVRCGEYRQDVSGSRSTLRVLVLLVLLRQEARPLLETRSAAKKHPL